MRRPPRWNGRYHCEASREAAQFTDVINVKELSGFASKAPKAIPGLVYGTKIAMNEVTEHQCGCYEMISRSYVGSMGIKHGTVLQNNAMALKKACTAVVYDTLTMQVELGEQLFFH